MIAPWLATVVLLLVVAVSRWCYDHRGRRYAQGKRAPLRSSAAFRPVYAWVRWSVPVAGLGALWSTHPAWLPWRPGAVLQVLGLLLALAALGLFVHAKRSLGRHYSPCHDAWLPDAVVQHGVYARIRHPIYTANLALLAGLAVGTGSGWLLLDALLVAAFYLPAARREERELAAAHPQYRDYLARTGRFLPRLRRAANPAPAR
ncbi:MAG: isoprenylcysteine carboxylmethyltransferase family protein [Planctomycetota bacterium]